MASEITYFQAIFDTLREELLRDERVVLIGEDLGLYTQTGLLPAAAAARIRSTPISENGFVGVAVGAAMTGLRPIVDLTISSFCYVAMDQLVNQAAKLRYMSGGQAELPLVVRSTMWHGSSNAAHHSDRPYPMFMNVPGLKIALPSTPAAVKGLLATAVRDDDPVLVFEDKNLWFQSGPVPEGDWLIPFGVAEVVRAGGDVTVVAIGGALGSALEAVDRLAKRGVAAELIDPRTLAPLDRATILESVAKTGRLVIVDPATRTCGAAAEIAAIVAEEAFDALRAPIQRVTTPDVPIPFSPPLEQPLYPSADAVEGALRRVLGEAG